MQSLFFFFQQRNETVRELQEQLRQHKDPSDRISSGHPSPASSTISVHSQDGLQREIDSLRSEKDRQDNEAFILQRSLEELSSRLEVQQQSIKAKDETIAQLMGMIQNSKGVESKQIELHKDQHSTDKKKLTEALNQLAKSREVIDERDRAIASLQEVEIFSIFLVIIELIILIATFIEDMDVTG